MPHYLLHLWQPTGGQRPSDAELAQIMANVEQVNDEIKAAGSWVFGGGLEGPETATVYYDQGRSGTPLITDGPYVEAKEYLGGISLIQAADDATAREWAARVSSAIGLPIELRAFHGQ